MTTDGASEYCAAFKYFSDNYNSIASIGNQAFDWEFFDGGGQVVEPDPGAGSGDGGADVRERNMQRENTTSRQFDEDSENEDDNVGYNRIELGSDRVNPDSFVIRELFEGDEYRNNQFLPNMNRISCSSHLMDKLGSKDVEFAKHDPIYAAIHKRVFDKLEKIWALKSSRLSSEVFFRHTQRKLIGPHRIRWLKTFDAVRTLFDYCFLNFFFRMFYFCNFFVILTIKFINEFQMKIFYRLDLFCQSIVTT